MTINKIQHKGKANMKANMRLRQRLGEGGGYANKHNKLIAPK
jgi:hypothetical protein